MKKILLALAIPLVLAGCKPGEEKAISLAQSEVSANLLDPGSAQFRNVKVVKMTDADDGRVIAVVCGEIYEAGEDFFTCYQGDVVFWRQVDKPVEGGVFVGYRGAQPAHVGLVLNRMALHSRGENGSVRMDSLLVIQRAFTKVEYFSYGAG